MKTVLDTSVLIDVLRGNAAAVSYLTALTDVPIASEVVRVELVRGLRSDERKQAEVLMNEIEWRSVTEDIARRAGEYGRAYRRSHAHLGVADLIVAATAAELGVPPATHSLKHFPMFKGLKPPY